MLLSAVARSNVPGLNVAEKSVSKHAVVDFETRSHHLRSLKFGLLNAKSVGNKSTIITEIIDDRGFNLFLLTEKWHIISEDVALHRCVPPSCVCFDVP